MASIKFSKKVFEKEIGKLTKEMQEKIALFGTTVESIDDKEVELDVTPNRPDLLSYHGFRRGFLAFIGKKTGLKEYKLHKPDKKFEVKVSSSVKDVRPHTVCSIIKGLRFDDNKIKEIIDLQEKLHQTMGRKRKKLAIGIYPIEKIELPIKYEALEPDKIKFMPLESTKEMSGLQILQSHETGKSYSHLLAGKSKFPVFSDSKGKILSMPPIINSEETGRVTNKTRDIFIECSGFDLELLEKCLNILVSIFAEMGGKIYQMKVGGKIYPTMKPEENKISLENVNKLLGLELKEKEIISLLEKMGHSYKKGVVKTPSWRVDILHEVDFIEEVAIAYGYDKFVPEIPEVSTIGGEDKDEITKRKISEILSGAGILEISNYHLTKKGDQFSKMGIPEKNGKKFVELADSKTEYNILRRDLNHYLMKVFSENIDSEYPQKIFEIGRVFELNSREDLEEKEKLSIGFAPGNFTDVKKILDYLFTNLDLKFELKEQEDAENFFIEGRSADILMEGIKIGFIGEVHPKILKNWKIKMPVSLMEMDLENIFKKFK